MPRVVLDANALMMPFQFGLNLTAEIERLLGQSEVYVPSSVRSELRKLSQMDKAAKAALGLAERFADVATKTKGDDAIVEAALALDAVVVTNDSDLLGKLKEKGVRRIRLRSRSHLVLEGD
jgi:rRNA-processing protein FCF1